MVLCNVGPLSETVCDFWRMVWEKRLPTIVMLTELMEGGRVSFIGIEGNPVTSLTSFSLTVEM